MTIPQPAPGQSREAISKGSESWIRVLRERQNELETIASWASNVGYGEVRDLCRQAKSRLEGWVTHYSELDARIATATAASEAGTNTDTEERKP